MPRIRSWPAGPKTPSIEGFAGFKVGMTHAFLVDYRKRSTTAGQEVSVPVTVVETPPLRIAASRLYRTDPYGKKVVAEVWADNVSEALEGRIPGHPGSSADARNHFERVEADEVRLVAFAQPALVPSVPSKIPSIFELRVSGDDWAARRKFALEQVGKELSVDQLTREGEFVDCIGITKGKGFQGHTKRWGVKLQPRKNSKHRRMIGTLGPHNPSFVTYRIPQAGQMGYHRRTAFNLRVLRVVKDPRKDPVTPVGGFPQYGEVRNACLLLHGSLPGPAKRLLRFRAPMRRHTGAVEKVEIRYLSTRSKQGA